MQFIIDVQPAAGGWSVHVLDGESKQPVIDSQTGLQLATHARQLRSLAGQGPSPLVFPLPPPDDVQDINPAAPHYQLCTATDAEVIRLEYAKIVGRTPDPDGVAVFGRYLFDTLLGSKLWADLRRLAGADTPLELTFYWLPGNDAINRLPLEMMHDGTEFLGAQRDVAVTRRVVVGTDAPDIAPESLEISSPPRVLFVVGTSLNNDVIRPGAEYLGLLRSLNAADLRLQTRLLLQASIKKIETLIRSFQPTVVHFICHGNYAADGKPYLELVDDEKPSLKVQVKAENLGRVLCDTAQTRPQIVVLNACHTASNKDNFLNSGQVSSPMAVELVQRGIPIIVAMAGEVADHACRLFTRRFYETMLVGGDAAFAAAEGRRVGIIMYGNQEPNSTVDWALPTFFISSNLHTAQLTRLPQPAAADLEGIAGNYATPENYPAFCGRLNLFEWYNILMSDGRTQRLTSPESSEFQALTLAVANTDSDADLTARPRYGRTWLLHEIAAQSVRDGHVPCLVDRYAATAQTADWPKTLPEVLDAIVTACESTGLHFGTDAGGLRFLPAILRISAGASLPAGCPPEISDWYKGQPDNPIFLARVLQYELMSLLDQICRGRAQARYNALTEKNFSEEELFVEEQEKTRLLLLVDDLHRMGRPAVEGLLNFLLGPQGLRSAGERARIVLTYASQAAQGQAPSVDFITSWVKRREVQDVPLQGFNLPDDMLAYKQFLLNWREKNTKHGPRRPLTVRATAKPKFIDYFFEKLHNAAEGGVPSFLAEREEVSKLIWEATMVWPKLDIPDMDILRPANDDKELELAQKKGGQ